MISAIIPNWNGAANLARLLDSLKRQTLSIDETLVVDAASTDDSIGVVERAGARIIPLDNNYGFAYAVNRGIEAARGDRLAILNNDVELHPAWLATLAAQDAWFATGKILDQHGRIDGTYDAICRGACSWRCGAGRADSEPWNEITAIRFAPFTAALFRAELFRRVGLLDEDYVSYLEDVDFGLRCALSGLSGVYVPEARTVHQGSGTLGRWNPETVRHIARNQLLLVAKNYPGGWLASYGWPLIVAQGLWGLVALRHGAGFAYVQGKWQGVRSFGRMRRHGPSAIREILAQSEAEIRDLQNQTGFDMYWKLYFALT